MVPHLLPEQGSALPAHTLETQLSSGLSDESNSSRNIWDAEKCCTHPILQWDFKNYC